MPAQNSSRSRLETSIIPKVAFQDEKISIVSAFLMDAAGFQVVAIDEDQRVTLSAENVSVYAAIESLMKSSDLICEIDSNGVIYFNGKAAGRPNAVVVSSLSEKPSTVAASPAKKDKQVSMRLMPVYDDDHGKTLRHIIVLDEVGFNSVKAFKSYLKRTKQGYVLTWDPGCMQDAGMPFSDKQSRADLKAFCTKHKIELIILPSEGS